MNNTICLVLCLLVQTGLFAQWINSNPGAGGQIQHVVCDPNITGKMYVCIDMEGFYVSDDYGDHWKYKGWKAPYSFVFNVAVEPGNSDRLYLTSSQGVAITDDAGNSWKIIKQAEGMSVATIAVSQKNKNWICFAESWLETAIGNKQGALNLYFSTDRGKTWQNSTILNNVDNKNVYSISFHPKQNINDVLISNSDGIFVSSDGFNSWQKIPSPDNVTECQGCDLTPDGNWLYAVFIRNDGKTGLFVKQYRNGNWQELDPDGHLQSLNKTHWRPKVWPGYDDRKHYVLIGVLHRKGNYNDNALNEGRFIVENDRVIGHVNQILKVKSSSEPFDVGWNAYSSMCRTYQYYPEKWQVPGINRGVFSMCQQSTFRGDAAKPGDWVVNTCHLYDTKNLHKFYRTNGTASTWVWDIAGTKNYVAMGMGDNGVVESWDNGISWTQKFAPTMWNVDALEIVEGETTLALAGRTDGFGGALNETQGSLFYREIDLEKPQNGWEEIIDGKSGDLKGLDPVLNRIATIHSDPRKPERVYVGTDDGLYVTENIFKLIDNNPEYYLKNISKPVIGSTLTRRIHVDPNDSDILFLRCWKGTYRIEKQSDNNYNFIQLKVGGSNDFIRDGWGHNGDIAVWADDTTTWLMITRNLPEHWELWLSADKGKTFKRILTREKAFSIRPPEGDWYNDQSQIRFGGLCGRDSFLFTSVHKRGGGEGLTKGISFLKGLIQSDGTVIWKDFTGNPEKNGIWFPAARSGKIWEDQSGHPTLHIATMGAGMWKRSLAEVQNAKAAFSTDTNSGNIPLKVNFDASASLPSESADEIFSYEWDFGNGKTADGMQVNHKYMQKKTHTAKLTITDDQGNTGYAYKNIEAYFFRPVADFVASKYNSTTMHEIRFYGELSFDENPNDSIVYYSWDFGDGNFGTGKNITHTYTESGTFNVKLTARNRAYQSSSAYKNVKIELNTSAQTVPAITNINIYPNPVYDKLYIKANNNSGIEIYNHLGQLVFHKKEFCGDLEISTNHWPNDIYFVSVFSKKASVEEKIIIH